MSLVGSLEDLGLADILQIVSLARKSGRLLLRSDDGEGWIALQDGLVRGAAVKGQREGPARAAGRRAGHVDAEAFDRASRAAARRGARARGGAAAGRRALQRVAAGGAARRRRARGDAHVRLAQRRVPLRGPRRHRDRTIPARCSRPASTRSTWRWRRHASATSSCAPSPRTRRCRASGTAPIRPRRALLQRRGRGAPMREAHAAPDAATHRARAGAAPRAAGSGARAAGRRREIPVSERRTRRRPIAVRLDAGADRRMRRDASEAHLVAVDADLGALEWLKAVARGALPARAHLPARRRALERVRQYLRRGELPVVAISSRM